MERLLKENVQFDTLAEEIDGILMDYNKNGIVDVERILNLDLGKAKQLERIADNIEKTNKSIKQLQTQFLITNASLMQQQELFEQCSTEKSDNKDVALKSSVAEKNAVTCNDEENNTTCTGRTEDDEVKNEIDRDHLRNRFLDKCPSPPPLPF